MQKTYMHTGVPVPAKMDGMNYMDSLKVWIGYNKDYDIEYLYWEKDTPAAYRMVVETHVAYKVADVQAAVDEVVAAGAAVLLPKLVLGGTTAIAFVSIKDGPVVEFYQD